ncbi:MAG: tetratricopeptide repeat protein [Anaerolineae bacterium]|nr:tetratricopeptide repeat protein [Anaerolineae bacterium]
MYLRTPKRYRTRRRRLRLFSARTVVFLLLIPVIGAVGWYVWENQQAVRDTVLPEIEGMVDNMQTQVAVQPTPTVTPNLAIAKSSCLNADRLGNTEEAIRQCSILAESSPNDVELYFKVTHMLVITSNFGQDAERLAEAREFAEKTINANPEAPHGWAIRAMTLDWGGDYGGALASALHARSLDDTFAPTYAFLGSIYEELGQYDVALGYLNQAREMDTAGLVLADTFRTLGALYNTQGDREEAVKNYELALQQAPQQAYIAIELSFIYMALQEVDTAIQVLVSALEKNPGDPGVLWALGVAHFRSGMKERAYEYYQRCLDNDQNNVLCLSYLGGLYFFDGDYVTASNNLERAIRLGSDDPDDFFQMGRSLSAMDRCPEATTYLQQGYDLVTERGQFDKQANFINALQDCGVSITSGQ